MKRACLLGLLLAFCARVGAAQQVRQVRLQDLPRLHQTYGADSLWQVVRTTPIWLANQPVAFTLLHQLPPDYTRYSPYRSYLQHFAQAVPSAELARAVWQVLERDLAVAEQVDYTQAEAPLLDEDVLLTLLFQNAPQTEQWLASLLVRYTSLCTRLAAQPKPTFWRYFRHGLGPAGWSKVKVELSRYQLLVALHRLNPTRYPATQVRAQQQCLHVPYTHYVLPRTPTPSTCSTPQLLPFEPVVYQGVSFPKQCTQACTLLKLVESEQVYFVEGFCPSPTAGFGGYSNTYLVRQEGATVQICQVGGWIS
jgi:hypothetical protein